MKGNPITFSYCTANGDKPRALGTPVLNVEAKHFSGSTRKATGGAAWGLPRHVFLAQRAKVIRNLWSEVELDNNIWGEVVDVVWDPGQRTLVLAEFVAVRSEEYNGPAWSLDHRYVRCEPFTLVETLTVEHAWFDGLAISRQGSTSWSVSSTSVVLASGTSHAYIYIYIYLYLFEGHLSYLEFQSTRIT